MVYFRVVILRISGIIAYGFWFYLVLFSFRKDFSSHRIQNGKQIMAQAFLTFTLVVSKVFDAFLKLLLGYSFAY